MGPREARRNKAGSLGVSSYGAEVFRWLIVFAAAVAVAAWQTLLPKTQISRNHFIGRDVSVLAVHALHHYKNMQDFFKAIDTAAQQAAEARQQAAMALDELKGFTTIEQPTVIVNVTTANTLSEISREDIWGLLVPHYKAGFQPEA